MTMTPTSRTVALDPTRNVPGVRAAGLPRHAARRVDQVLDRPVDLVVHRDAVRPRRRPHHAHLRARRDGPRQRSRRGVPGLVHDLGDDDRPDHRDRPRHAGRHQRVRHRHDPRDAGGDAAPGAVLAAKALVLSSHAVRRRHRHRLRRLLRGQLVPRPRGHRPGAHRRGRAAVHVRQRALHGRARAARRRRRAAGPAHRRGPLDRARTGVRRRPDGLAAARRRGASGSPS